MCGIAGSINFKLPEQRIIRQLMHRGPDEQQIWQHKGITFIHARLAIQELSAAGRQPMHRNGLHIIYNGEIYNHMELRQLHELDCMSHSDTETLLHLYEKKGLGMLNDLDGMFALALYDETKEKLFLIRDRAGEKPLYFAADNNKVLFASELSVLQAILLPTIDKQRMANFLAVGYLPTSETPYINIQELPPGTYAEIDVKSLVCETKKWWSIAPSYRRHYVGSYSDALAEVDQLLSASVKRRLLSSDLEVGTFLSGGIDSGLVTALAVRQNNRLKTFTVSFEGSYNEAPLAAQVAHQLGTQHHEISISLNNLETDMEKIFRNYGEPIMDDSIIPSYYVARESKKHLTVILNGDAGDELFGGYRRYVPFTKLDLFSGKWSFLAKPLQNVLPRPQHKLNYYNYLYRLLSLLSVKGKDVYFSATNDLLHQQLDVFRIQPDLKNYAVMEKEDLELLTPLKQLMKLDFDYLLPSTLLVKMDIATMVSSLEGRCPFLSKELLEFIPGLPDNMKIRKGTTKYLLRDLARRYLPREIVNQPKRGFEVPLREWIDTRLKDMVSDYLLPKQAFVKEIVLGNVIDKLVMNKYPGIHPEQRARILFSLLSVECFKKGLNT